MTLADIVKNLGAGILGPHLNQELTMFVRTFLILALCLNLASAFASTDDECTFGIQASIQAQRRADQLDFQSAFEESLIDQGFYVVPSSANPDYVINIVYTQWVASGVVSTLCFCDLGYVTKKATAVTLKTRAGVSILTSEKSSELSRGDIQRLVREMKAKLQRGRTGSCSLRTI